MQKKQFRYGDFIKEKRVNDPRELRQSDVAKMLGISTSLYGEIEHSRRPPFNLEKSEIFAEIFNLTNDEKALMYDLAAREKNQVPADIEEIFMYSEIGDLSRQLFRELQNGHYEEENWKQLIREAEKEKNKRKGASDE